MFIHDTFYVPQHFYISEHSLSQLDTSKMTPMIDISLYVRETAMFGLLLRCSIGSDGVVSNGQGRKYIGSKMTRIIPKWTGICSDMWGCLQVDDLVCRLGYPYVYVHQGSCEHVFYFTDLQGDEMPADPVHMCEACFTSYHFVYQHRRDLKSTAHPYVDPSCLQL
uniref:snRNA-activating protein complex subunit 3 n=1 Tax=Parascaris equorum TaxID=6256 RepID=A0A914S685_PAREQ